MFTRTLLAFLVLPGTVAGLLPWFLAFTDPWCVKGWSVGFALLGFGLTILLWCVRDFYVSGRGTLAPWDPPKHLVVVGLYRFTRNPMYIGVLLIVSCWALLTGSPLLLAYLILLAVVFHFRVVLYEEPRLLKQFGVDWANYSERVPRWLSRITPC